VAVSEHGGYGDCFRGLSHTFSFFGIPSTLRCNQRVTRCPSCVRASGITTLLASALEIIISLNFSEFDYRVGVCAGGGILAEGAGAAVVRDGADASMSRVIVKFKRTSLSR